jgi:hypothetical protein
MFNNRLVCRLAVVASASFLAIGCSAKADDSADESEDAVTGVTDLTEMEAALGLTIDSKDAEGNWSRGPAKYRGGPCYAKTRGQSNGRTYEARRYTHGAAFFKKKGTAPGTSDLRPVLCVDVDVGGETIAVDDFELDTVIRYRMGALLRRDGAAGSSYLAFDNGHFRYVNQFCQGFDASNQTALASGCLGEVKFPGSQSANTSLLLLAYQYAAKTAKSIDRYSFADDPVGRYVSTENAEQGASPGVTSSVQNIHFEKVDLRFISSDGYATLAIVPKNTPTDKTDERALALCRRDPAHHFDCRGL